MKISIEPKDSVQYIYIAKIIPQNGPTLFCTDSTDSIGITDENGHTNNYTANSIIAITGIENTLSLQTTSFYMDIDGSKLEQIFNYLATDSLNMFTIVEIQKISTGEVPPTQFEKIIAVSTEFITKNTAGTVNNPNIISLKLEDFSKLLEMKQTTRFSKICRATLGDERCKVNLTLEKYIYYGKVTSVIDEYHSFIGNHDRSDRKPDFFFINGIIEFTSTDLPKIKYSIAMSKADGTIYIRETLPFGIKEKTTYTITLGCNKTLQDCKNKFQNSLNFYGEPHIPDNTTLQ